MLLDGSHQYVPRECVQISINNSQLTVPMEFFHLKEIIFRASMSYDEEDFAEVVNDFSMGKLCTLDKRSSTLI